MCAVHEGRVFSLLHTLCALACQVSKSCFWFRKSRGYICGSAMGSVVPRKLLTLLVTQKLPSQDCWEPAWGDMETAWHTVDLLWVILFNKIFDTQFSRSPSLSLEGHKLKFGEDRTLTTAPKFLATKKFNRKMSESMTNWWKSFGLG